MRNSVSELTDEKITRENGGCKAANLRNLIRQGYTVPNGFVVLVDAFEQALSTASQKIPDLSVKLRNAVASAGCRACAKFCEELIELIKKSPVPPETEREIAKHLGKSDRTRLLAVRSSATVEDSENYSWAGQFKTCLKVPNSLREVLSSIQLVWASVFSPRVFGYAKHIGIDIENVKMAVIVQDLVENPDFSGVLFTQHPNGYSSCPYVEAVTGYGERLVSGKVIPSSYVLSKGDSDLETDGLLPSSELHKLRDLALSVEDSLGSPQDIEWSIKNGIIYLLQTRPISVTGLKFYRTTEGESLQILAKGLPASSGIGIGKTRLIFNIDDAISVKNGDVIVSPMTNPDMVPYMSRAAGIVTDVGGMICHTAIVAREMGIPCVVGTGNATSNIPSETQATIDGDTGIVYKGSHSNLNKKRKTEWFSLVVEKAKSAFGQYNSESQLSILSKKESVDVGPKLIDLEHSSKLDSTQKFFGHEPELVWMSYPYPPRMGPWWQENWQHEWTHPQEAEVFWGNVRPEVINTPLTKSLIVQGVESIPFVFQIGEIGPLYTKWRKCRIHIPLDELDKVRMSLAKRLVNDQKYFLNYINLLHEVYTEWNAATLEVRTRLGSTRDFSVQYLIDRFKYLWKIHERFFALCFLIQTIGDDVVWPAISRMNIFIFKRLGLQNPEAAANHLTRTLASPPYQTLSSKYLDSLRNLYNLQRELSDEANGKDRVEWESAVNRHLAAWGWMRDRDLLYNPLDSKEEVENVLKGFKESFQSQVDAGTWEKSLEVISSCLEPHKSRKIYLHMINLGVKLHMEREDHHVIWVQNVHVMRQIILRLARHLKKAGYIHREEDVFFLQIPEVLSLFENPSKKIRSVAELIPNRRLAFLMETRHTKDTTSNTSPEPEEDYY